MSEPMAHTDEYDAEGKWICGSTFALPASLDWMPIVTKVYWFKLLGRGSPSTKHVLIKSQGEQHLFTVDQPLANLDHKTYKERINDCDIRTQAWIDEQGISRQPRNQ